MPTIRPATPIKEDGGKDAKLKTVDEAGKTISEQTVTLGLVCVMALRHRDRDARSGAPEEISFDEMCRRGELIRKIQDADTNIAPLDISNEDAVLIKSQFAKAKSFDPTVALQIRDLLDPKEKSEADEKTSVKKKAA